MQIAPFAIALAFLPGPAYLHWMLPLFLVLTAGFTAAAYADDLRARRLKQHGLPLPGEDRHRPPDAL